jgi:amidohydrolase
MMFSGKQILREAEALLPEIIETRRHLHRHPELSYCENDTSAYISGILRDKGIEHITGVAGTGIIGVIEGGLSGQGMTAALRADMDALPVTEDNISSYCSINNGVMHACGHDAHMAMLVGAAGIINRLRAGFSGRALLIFQPGEEKAPGGAKLITDSGILDNYKPDIFLAQHVTPDLPSGTAGICAGPAMASCDEIYITVTGKGGHAARPSDYTDQIRIASELVIRLKDLIEKASPGQAPTVLGIGRIVGMGATNVIPEKVEIAGTFRTFDEKWRQAAKDLMLVTAAGLAAEKGVQIDLKIVEGYPVLVNNSDLTRRAASLCEKLLGSDMVRDIDPRMGSEDFSFYAEKYPSLMYRLGVTKKGDTARQLHTSTFDIDESAMATGTAILAWLALNMMH